MRVICGMVDAEHRRRLFVADCSPSIGPMEDLTEGGVREEIYDWGEISDQAACERTAYAILSRVTDSVEADSKAADYAFRVVSRMCTDKMWILSFDEVSTWLRENRKVM